MSIFWRTVHADQFGGIARPGAPEDVALHIVIQELIRVEVRPVAGQEEEPEMVRPPRE